MKSSQLWSCYGQREQQAQWPKGTEPSTHFRNPQKASVTGDCSRRKWMCGVTCPVCPRREEKGSRVSRKDCSLYSHRCRIQEHRNNMRYIYVLL
ncbi:PREDICTED: uncharacterized protein LOC109387176 isoform X2 [Hipposideros armiger]|uniref:Uncharacterized protein LOC109387176 isoform X2 n=1 Tax=Hipposideros armiger TaxID=186990 RepID=A0A8B7RZG4_HIPAR|nr:PREDICTED: uncharacterized protein LOC109387176 isoform X2 [Hipposideros armiger]